MASRKSTEMASRKRRAVWTEDDEVVFLEKWAERSNDLRRAKRNAHVYNDISLQMGSGKFTTEEVHIKVKNLTKRYREEKSKMGPSGGSPSTWKHYAAVHRIVGGTAVNTAPIIESWSLNSSSNISTPSPLTLSLPSLSPSPAPAMLSPLLPPSPLPPPAADPDPSSSSVPLSPLPPLSPVNTSAPGRKRKKFSELVKIMKEQTELLKEVVNDSKTLTNEIVDAIKENNASSQRLTSIIEKLVDRL